jgi:triosephosphate isomerase
MKKLVIANWKMNPVKGSEAEKKFHAINAVASKLKNVETVICPPLVYLQSLGREVTTRVCVLGAQDAFWEHEGAYTGQVSPDMVFNTKARYVIVGHSERRAMGETDDMVNKKVKSILTFPLIPIVCVGEIERDSDSQYVKFLKQQIHHTLEGLSVDQVERLVIAYEPVWAISSKAKRACTPAECRETVHVIKQVLADLFGSTEKVKTVPIVYGGSVNALDIEGYLEDGLVDGVLVGHASLDPKEFVKILKTAERLGK